MFIFLIICVVVLAAIMPPMAFKIKLYFHFKILLEEIKTFIQHPYTLTLKESKAGTKEKLFDIGRVYLLGMIFLIGSVILLVIIDTILKQTMGFSIYQALKHNRQLLYEHFGKNAWLIIVIVAPLAEELMFRLPLSKNKNGFVTGVACLFFYFTGDTITHPEDFTPLRIFTSVFLYILLFYFLKEKTFQELRRKYFNVLCWGLIVSFSWLHIGNFQPIHWNVIYLYPLYVLPQLFYGVGLSFLMVKYRNVLWPLLLHVLINSVGVLLHLF